MATEAGLATAFERDRPLLFGLLYRLTGSSADAEDLVQATFERALARPPSDTTRPWRPWLLRVAMNLGRDHLRSRRRRRYDGPWLPGPLEVPECELTAGLREPQTTEGRYALLESVSYAFLVALEALTPTQRAVLLLRDVFEYSGRETAGVLEISEVGVRQHLRRARSALAGYERERARIARPSHGEVREVLVRFLRALARGDAGAVEELLAADVVLRTDGGGEFAAGRVPVVGRSKVARFYRNLARQAPGARVGVRLINGAPALLTEIEPDKPHIAPRVVTFVILDEHGCIGEIYGVLATRKLAPIARLAQEEALSPKLA